MTTLIKTLAVSAVALSASVATADAFELYGFIKPNISQFGEPVQLVMQHVDGNYRLKSSTTNVPVSYEAGVNGVQSDLRQVDVKVDHITKGDGAWLGVRRQLDGKDKVWGNVALPMSRAHLEPMEKLGKELCESHEGPGVKNINTIIPLEMSVMYYSTNAFAPGHGIGSFKRATTVPATIVCEAPVRRVPPTAKSSQPAQNLIAVKLFTTPARPQCNAPVTLRAQFTTQYPVKVDFTLYRGDGEQQQTSSVYAGKYAGNLHMQTWSRTYTFNKTESRKYRIIPQGSPLTTEWVNIDVHCTGGFAGTPGGNTNPDGMPKSPPKQPKGTFDADALSTGKPKPTHGSFRPVIAPATVKAKTPVVAPATSIKTAPANGNPPRALRYLGKGAPQAGL